MKKNSLPVWSWRLRALHWSLALLVVLAWFTGGMAGIVHDYLGYAAAVIVTVRLWLGFRGEHYARFSQFVCRPQLTWQYLCVVLSGRAPRYLGHNPLGGWMVLGLLSCVALLGLTGWLYTTDWLWGYAWLWELHVALAWLLVMLVALHLAGVVFTGWQHRENLLSAMLSGNKRPPGGDDVA